MKRLLSLLVSTTALVFILVQCNGDDPIKDPIDKPVKNVVPAQLTTPFNEAQYTIGEAVEVAIKINAPEGISNLELFVDDTLYAGELSIEDQNITIITDSLSKVGWTKILLSYTDADGKRRSDFRKIVYFSNLFPSQKNATIVNTYTHDKGSYTQGLEFYEGALYEGTGQYNRSVLSEVELTTGTQIRKHDLDGSIFGEGITILNDTIYQITYRAQTCYMYDMDFNQIGMFKYDGEGWGLCNDGENLIMSNGDSEIVWRNPRTFEVVKSIEVFDDDQSVDQLNELELINGRLFMNIYRANKIAEVDTATGKVMAYINCQNLANDANDFGNDVLNGIAYNPATGKIYVTGKLWPKLYEVKFE
ncbi:MAG: glutaminyl-peptide cyclotransferase [Crocinitomix sp.]|nr:glutaminyl-peptide cyclotransferase [Crocinitomix sp.]